MFSNQQIEYFNKFVFAVNQLKFKPNTCKTNFFTYF